MTSKNFYRVDAAGRIDKLSGADLKELTGAATVAAAMDAIRNDVTGREDFAEICFSYREACAIARMPRSAANDLRNRPTSSRADRQPKSYRTSSVLAPTRPVSCRPAEESLQPRAAGFSLRRNRGGAAALNSKFFGVSQ